MLFYTLHYQPNRGVSFKQSYNNPQLPDDFKH